MCLPLRASPCHQLQSPSTELAEAIVTAFVKSLNAREPSVFRSALGVWLRWPARPARRDAPTRPRRCSTDCTRLNGMKYVQSCYL